MINPSDVIGGGKEAMARKMMAKITPSEHPIGQAVVEAIVSTEHQQAQVVEQLRQAADLEVEHGHNLEARREHLYGLADAVADQELVEWWFREIAADALENPKEASKYAGLEAEEWAQQKRDWYDQYHEADLVDEILEDADQEEVDDLADRHLREMYDVGLEDFKAIVVDWTPRAASEQLLAGQIHRHNQVVAKAAEEVERLQERVDELEEELDGDK